jgi:hypothetical protein
VPSIPAASQCHDSFADSLIVGVRRKLALPCRLPLGGGGKDRSTTTKPAAQARGFCLGKQSRWSPTPYPTQHFTLPHGRVSGLCSAPGLEGVHERVVVKEVHEVIVVEVRVLSVGAAGALEARHERVVVEEVDEAVGVEVRGAAVGDDLDAEVVPADFPEVEPVEEPGDEGGEVHLADVREYLAVRHARGQFGLERHRVLGARASPAGRERGLRRVGNVKDDAGPAGFDGGERVPDDVRRDDAVGGDVVVPHLEDEGVVGGVDGVVVKVEDAEDADVDGDAERAPVAGEVAEDAAGLFAGRELDAEEVQERDAHVLPWVAAGLEDGGDAVGGPARGVPVLEVEEEDVGLGPGDARRGGESHERRAHELLHGNLRERHERTKADAAWKATRPGHHTRAASQERIRRRSHRVPESFPETFKVVAFSTESWYSAMSDVGKPIIIRTNNRDGRAFGGLRVWLGRGCGVGRYARCAGGGLGALARGGGG